MKGLLVGGWPTWFRDSFTAAAQLASHLNWLENTQTQIVSIRMEEPSLPHYQCEQCPMLYAFQHSIIIYIPLKLTQHVQNLIGEHTDCEQTDGGTFSPALSMSAHSSKDVLLKILLQSTLNSSCPTTCNCPKSSLELTMMLMQFETGGSDQLKSNIKVYKVIRDDNHKEQQAIWAWLWWWGLV